jgi:D-glycero-alpha-D-manno-heptose-7-phosphate kinase
MIIARSPLRITLGGGGTDLPSYSREHGGFAIAAAIDASVFVALASTLDDALVLRCPAAERVAAGEPVTHPIVREALALTGVPASRLELTSFADVPAGTGLGSSSSFTTALLAALHAAHGRRPEARELAEQACEIEIERLAEPIGRQDQYIAAYGGLRVFEFRPDGAVDCASLAIGADTRTALESRLLLYFTGVRRRASEILREQDERSRRGDEEMTAHLHRVKEIGMESRTALEAGDLGRFAELLHRHWEHKKARTSAMTSDRIDGSYELARRHGALGGKLVGAGSGGFLMLYAEDPARVREALDGTGLVELHFRFTETGTTVIVS